MSKKNSKMGIKLHILIKTIVFPDIFLRYSIFRFFIYYAWRYKTKKSKFPWIFNNIQKTLNLISFVLPAIKNGRFVWIIEHILSSFLISV